MYNIRQYKNYLRAPLGKIVCKLAILTIIYLTTFSLVVKYFPKNESFPVIIAVMSFCFFYSFIDSIYFNKSIRRDYK